MRWGIVGTGAIARLFALSLPQSRTGRAVAVGSRTQASADRFGDAHGIERRHASYDALLADDEVEAVYVATPHPGHEAVAVAAAAAGKHLLVEKPLGMSRAQADTIIAAAGAADVFCMEAFMYRCHPQTERLVELVAGGVIGDVRLVRATFSFHSAYDPASRLLDPVLGGGGILDVGCYTASMATLVARATGKLDADAIEVSGAGHVGATGVDEWAAATVRFGGGLLAQLSTGVQLTQDNAVEVFGSEGRLTVPSPWQPRERSTLVLRRPNAEPEEIVVEAPTSLYALEADHVADHVDARQAPAMPWEDSLTTAAILDRWLAAAGVRYPVGAA